MALFVSCWHAVLGSGCEILFACFLLSVWFVRHRLMCRSVALLSALSSLLPVYSGFLSHCAEGTTPNIHIKSGIVMIHHQLQTSQVLRWDPFGKKSERGLAVGIQGVYYLRKELRSLTCWMPYLHTPNWDCRCVFTLRRPSNRL